MPKDATKNVDRYKIRGGQLNEFEYTQRQKALAEKKPMGEAKLIPGTPPEEAGKGLQPRVKATATKGAKSKKAGKAAKSTKKAKVNTTKGATAKKLAARKAAKKSRPAAKK